MKRDVTAIIPSIPPRAGMLVRAVASVTAQTAPPAALSIAIDTQREGAPATRDRALRAARTTWVATLDDDDEWMPQHLERLLDCAEETGADFVYSWYQLEPPGRDPLPHFGKPFDPANPILTTIVTLVRTELAQQVGYLKCTPDEVFMQEDWMFVLGCVAAGAKIVHLPEHTWTWHHHGGNTSGRPDRW
ncbi:glycosyltransferase family 2 protein [Parafrankia discariae]|uniref:glycosyltransferase family 2 protein n=1 Tax=Parafrankia discariae TaxID=365528 RepID=UPI0003784A92|nr:glycosyltransferase [Parafrankia discariae]